MLKKTSHPTFRYTSTSPLYALCVSEREDKSFRFGIGTRHTSRKEGNYLLIVERENKPKKKNVLKLTRKISQPHPATALKFLPSNLKSNPDMVASASDFIRIFVLKDNQTKYDERVFDSNKESKYNGPLTGMDWCRTDLQRMLCCSIDSSCAVWDIKKEKLITQLVAHEKEVFDCGFHINDGNVFCTCGSDGSVRVFDCRSLKHSTIVYEGKGPIVRAKWNKLDCNQIAATVLDEDKIVLLDLRIPLTPLEILKGHSANVNCVDWAPHSSVHLLSGSDDRNTLIWDTTSLPGKGMSEDPCLVYLSSAPILQSLWSHNERNYVALLQDKHLQVMRV